MINMSSLEAQNQFGALIDASLLEPVVITRRGWPVSGMISCEDLQDLSFSVVKLISELKPLRGEAASQAMAQTLANLNPNAAPGDLTEVDFTQLVHERR